MKVLDVILGSVINQVLRKMNLYDSEKKYELNLLHCNSPHDNHLCLRQCVEASEDKTEAETKKEDVEHLPLGVQDHHHLIMQDQHHIEGNHGIVETD